MLAESYQGAEVLETFEKNNKRYARIKRVCYRCGGSGRIWWSMRDNGVCYDCRGAGQFTEDVRDYTEAEMQSIERAKERRKEKQQQEFKEKQFKANLKTAERYGFTSATGFVVIGDTFAIKDELKEHGAKYSPELKWICPKEPTWLEGYKYEAVSINELFEFDANGWLKVKDDASDIISALQPKVGEYIGTIGSKVKVSVTVMSVFESYAEFNGHQSYSYKHIMKDENGNTVVWKTSTMCKEPGDTMTLVGTVKSHDEYKGTRQTILTRCKEV